MFGSLDFPLMFKLGLVFTFKVKEERFQLCQFLVSFFLQYQNFLAC